MHPVNRLILEIAQSGRAATATELDQILRHVARAGYPDVEVQAGSRLRGVEWKGRTLQEIDRLPYAEIHYLRHVTVGREWPEGTTLAGYLDSIRGVVLDPTSGVAISLWQGREWHLTV